MSSGKTLDARSPFVFDTHELGRRLGAMMVLTRQAPAPSDLGTGVIGVPPESPIDLELRLEEVGEGVLVTGTASAQLHGECGRCLAEISDDLEIDIQELFVHPGENVEDAGTSRLEGDLFDLEPLLRDQVVLDLPFQPVCRDDCLGLCPDCGVDLNTSAEHHHDAPVDPRWAELARLRTESGQPDQPQQ
ncbi:YceD family protein [Propionibacteriaceae bacterium Y2011]|uniref:YceD family protein n=1 Tax=Microlunatus sp. Y2014 TaxID=3418488 RepID=UPI003B49D089